MSERPPKVVIGSPLYHAQSCLVLLLIVLGYEIVRWLLLNVLSLLW